MIKYLSIMALSLSVMTSGSVYADTLTTPCSELRDRQGKLVAKASCNKSKSVRVTDSSGKLLHKVDKNGRITDRSGKYVGKVKTKD